jgi:hypothetical protein
MWLRVGPAAGSCEKGNEPSGSTKRGEFIEWLRTCELIREDSAPVKRLISQSMVIRQTVESKSGRKRTLSKPTDN